MIGDEIEVTVVDLRGDKVRLGINAPTRIAVHRKEVYEAIKRENEQAAAVAKGEMDTISSTVRPAAKRPPEGAAAVRLSARIGDGQTTQENTKGERRRA